MDTLRHFGTSHVPVAPHATGLCVCDVEPDVYRVFAFAVLALHQLRPSPGNGPAWCTCGLPYAACEVHALADGLLFADPAQAGQDGDGEAPARANPTLSWSTTDTPAAASSSSIRREITAAGPVPS